MALVSVMAEGGKVRGLGRWKYISALLWLHRLESGTNAMSRRAPPTHTRGRFRARPNHSVPALRMVWTVTREHGGRGTIGRGGGRLWGTAIAPLFSQITNLYRRNGCLAYLKNQSIRIEFVCALISFWTTFCCTHCCRCCCSCCTHCCCICCSHCCSCSHCCCSRCCICYSTCCCCSSRNRFGCRFCFYYFYSLVSLPTTI